jgi:O-antigen ligase
MMPQNFRNKIINFSFILFLLIPISLISGPFIPDFFLVIIVINFIVLICFKDEYKIINNKVLFLFLLFYFTVAVVSIFSLNISSIQSSLFYFRFGLFALAASILIEEKRNSLNYILYLLLFVYLALFFDSIYQFKFNENIFGFKILTNANFRITSFFGKDEILGSYSIRLLPLTIFLVILCFNSSINIKRILITSLVIISSVIILLSGERTSLALFILLILFLFSSSFELRKILLVPTIIALITLTGVILKNETIKERMVNSTINQLGLNKKSERLVLFSKTYEGHYLIALNMFKEKPIFGHGAKMFRFYCSKEENFVAINACTTHPHNFYAQMLSETGIIGFLFLISIFFYIVFFYLKNLYFQIIYKKQFITDFGLCLLSSYFITLFPILPSGNFFNNWLSIIIYYPLGFLIYTVNARKFYV